MGTSLSDLRDLLIPFIGKFGSDMLKLPITPFYVHISAQFVGHLCDNSGPAD
jgi:hypothetical protein